MPKITWKGQWDSVAIAAIVLLAFSFAFGGASHSHALRLALVELASLPLLVLASRRLILAGLWREHQFSLGLLAAVVAIPLIQLIPLPPAVWTNLPGRDQMVLALELAGLEPGKGEPVSIESAADGPYAQGKWMASLDGTRSFHRPRPNPATGTTESDVDLSNCCQSSRV